MDKQIKQLEAKKAKLDQERTRIENRIDELMSKDMEIEFQRLKKEVEKYNLTYDGHFTEELICAWKEEDAGDKEE